MYKTRFNEEEEGGEFASSHMDIYSHAELQRS